MKRSKFSPTTKQRTLKKVGSKLSKGTCAGYRKLCKNFTYSERNLESLASWKK